MGEEVYVVFWQRIVVGVFNNLGFIVDDIKGIEKRFDASYHSRFG